MAFTDSMFLFEILVEELKSYINCREFRIRSQFADIFTINLKDPNERRLFLLKRHRKIKTKRKTKTQNIFGKTSSDEPSDAAAMKIGQSILIMNDVETMISNMKQYPLDLSLWSKVVPDYKIGSTHIPWSAPYYEYLNKLHRRQIPPPVFVKGNYNVFDEFTSKRMAVIKLNIKMSYLKDPISPQLKSLSDVNQQTSMYNIFNPEPHTNNSPIHLIEETGTIKTIYSGEQGKIRKINKNKNKKKEVVNIEEPYKKERIAECAEVENNTDNRRFNSEIFTLVRSDTNIQKKTQSVVIKSKSCSSIDQRRLNTLNYIFGVNAGPFRNQVYCVEYFTVENNFADSPKSVASEKVASTVENSKSSKSDDLNIKQKYKFRICDSDCLGKKGDTVSCVQSVCSLDLPQEASHLITLKKCDRVDCDYKIMRELPTPPDDRILLDLSSLKKDCCDVTEKVTGGIKAMMKFGDDPCYCECECRFGFEKKTTFCNICGGYEIAGDEYGTKPKYDLPFPCPIFHKLPDKVKKTGSDTKKKKIAEPEKDTKKGKKKNKDDKFKFNYGYTAPQIGHSRCTFPCSGSLGVVPKHMGWLWTADNVPGLKFRPLWKPGATNKHVVRLLKIAKNPGQVTKKRKKDLGKVKKPLKRPLLVVQKKEGEYTVTMETMKTYTKPRSFNQAPYEDKPLVTYTIGRTSEENLQRKRKKERARRRLERLQRDFVQGAFRDMCQEICLKTYQQALGILPEAEHPDCLCYPVEPGPDRTDLDHSCSCSEDKELSESDTDSDEWIVEFTPPNATFYPTFKSKKVMCADVSTQYTYLDYRVKLLDRYGNPVSRYFKGPDGKQQCSDLGGFWSHDKKWLEINTDGYIGPDEKWAPNAFLGPNGEQVDAETGKFQAMNGKWLVVGVDGYIDPQGRWKFYPNKKPPEPKKKRFRKRVVGEKKVTKPALKPSEATWSCFGDVSPQQLSKMGIVGHGHDKKLLFSTLHDMQVHGEDVKIPETSTVPRLKKRKGKHHASRRYNYGSQTDIFADERKCRHAHPSNKGIVAVDGHGHKAYFKLKDFRNRRPK